MSPGGTIDSVSRQTLRTKFELLLRSQYQNAKKLRYWFLLFFVYYAINPHPLKLE